ncbi:MAG: glutamine amidotransferase [Candidatus Nomurabacteria bacterium]|jgi:CobQ-like glutamine amidotransferase family enzyme|nr:glutamine amidotransferase [Candidatus Nomurabacteria bacterium]
MTKSLKILSLYPREMNIYGDHGNLLCLTRRAQWRGIKVECARHEIGDELDESADIILGGGGQDSGQNSVADDISKNAAKLKKLAADGVPMLLICGMYQLFGEYFMTADGQKIPGIGIFDLTTRAGSDRLIGNITIETEFGKIVGYENHSGLTRLGQTQQPFGKVIKGAGNNGRNRTEGARVKNVFGSYLHGPILPKNPRLADEILRLALQRKYGDGDLAPLDDSLSGKARQIAMRRPR